MKNDNIVIKAENVSIFYDKSNANIFRNKDRKEVVKDISFKLYDGEILGIVGESGSGKTTLAKALVGLIKDYSGSIEIEHNNIQMVFQDPYSSLNPVKRIGWILEEPLKIKGGFPNTLSNIFSKDFSKDKRIKLVDNMLEQVGLPVEFKQRLPRELSGGQRQRVSIALALISNSKIVVLDEPVSALDVTIGAQMIELLLSLKEKFQLSYLFITHDLQLVNQFCDRVIVMYEGRIVEEGKVTEVFQNPKDDYTKTLLDSMLSLD